MKTRIWLITLIIGLCLLMGSCTSVYVFEISKSPEFTLNTLKSKSIVVVSSNEVFVGEFTKTFSKKYSNNRAFILDYSSQFAYKLESEKVFNATKYDNSENWDLLRSFAGAKEDLSTVDSLFSNSNADYIMNLSKFEISNRIVTSTVGGGPNSPPHTTSTEFCVVKSRFQIIDRKSRKRVLEFESKGEAGVMLFAFEKALNNAINNSIDNAVAYLKTGKKEF